MNESTNNAQTIASQEHTPQPCPGCSTSKAAGAAYCPKCGRSLEEKSPQPQAPQATVASTTAQPTAESQPKAQPAGPTPPKSPSPLPQQPSPTPEACQNQGPVAPVETQADVSQTPDPENTPPQPQKQAPLPPKPAVEAPYHLVCTHQDGTRTVVDLLSDDLLIGSSPNCDVQLLGDPHISRQHAKICMMSDKLVVQDMSSTNGSYLRLRKPTLMMEGDELLLGTTFVRLVQGPSPK